MGFDQYRVLRLIVKWISQYIVLLLTVLHAWSSSAQNPQHEVQLLTGEQPYILHPLIVSGSLTVTLHGAILDSSAYQLDLRQRHLWVPSVAPEDTVEVRYRIWDFNLPERFIRVRESLPLNDSTVVIPPVEETTSFSNSSQLRRSGSITRGVIAGNRRDARIESGLRLQMSGELSKDIRIRAALTDENTPILPEGTTQRLSELDRVYIEIETPYSKAQLGDFQVQLDQSTFAKLNRKIQGVGITAPLPIRGFSGQFEGAAATSRGLFRTQDVQVNDGVQGPYRLQGNANEPFILVIPGSESVYLDGILLQRGESQDYIIDYATGEITFTTNRLIRYHHRIAVEFQYRTTEFTRTLVATDATISTSKRASGDALASLSVSFIHEADGKSFDQEFGLTDADKDLLSQLGDQAGVRSGAVQVTYDPDAPWIHYMLRDTTISGQNYSIYLPITDASESDVYRVQFTRVGPGKGDYVRSGETTNGIVYRYQGPQQGEYLPVRVLPKPEEHRMIDVRGSFSPIQYVKIMGEWAHSYRDENRFSSLDVADNPAHSYHARLEMIDVPVVLGEVNLLLNRRQTGENFATFDRTQPIEFVRSWNLPVDRTFVQAHQETMDEITLDWKLSHSSTIDGTVGRLKQGQVFDGNRRQLSIEVDEPFMPKMDYQLHLIKSQADSVRGQWIRHRLQVRQAWVQERFNLRTTLMTSQRHQHIPEGLRQDSRQYWQVSPYAEINSKWGVLSAGLDWREEHIWVDDYRLIPGRRTSTTTLNYSSKAGQSFQSEGRIGLQYTDYANFFQTSQGLTNERSLVVRWNGRIHPWKHLFRMNWRYEVLSEQTPVLQEIYIRTGPELGEYVWNDDNGNGIVELDEFVPEVSQDEGDYVRTLIPSDSLQSVTGLKARLNIQFDGGQRWKNPSSSWQKWLHRIAFRTAIEIQEKSKDPDPINIYLLRQHRFRDPVNTIRGTLNLIQDLWLFRNHPGYGVHLSWRKVRSTNAFAADTEMRRIDEWRANLRWKIAERWGLTSEGFYSDKLNTSSAFFSREFNIRTWSFHQEVQFSIQSNFRISTGLEYAQKDAIERGKATIVKVPIQSTWDRAGRANLSGRIEISHVTLSQESGSTGLAFFELTDGRGSGRSLLWHFNGWIQLTRILRATITYSGRSPQDAPQIHTVRMQLSATF